ncbi:MAG TPA: hypothetical protein VES02_04180, partial [Dermatophilaceae bacterium]|nr:hypothetical protein [Dermatophilaceae bacterium]
TGLRVSSLYNTFGDKAALYQRAVQHYLDSFVRPRLARFAGPEASLEDLEQLLTSLLEEPLNDGYGCLVTNAVLEQGGSGGPAAGLVKTTFDELHQHAEDVLRREIGVDDAAIAAARVLLLYQGLLVFSRAGFAGELHGAAVRDEFTRLRAQRDRINAPKEKQK